MNDFNLTDRECDALGKLKKNYGPFMSLWPISARFALIETLEGISCGIPDKRNRCLLFLGISEKTYNHILMKREKIFRKQDRINNVRKKWILSDLDNQRVIIKTLAVMVILFGATYFFDERVSLFFKSFDYTLFRVIFLYITRLGESTYYFAVSGSIMILTYFINRYWSRGALSCFISLFGSGIVVNFIKPVVGRVRPEYFLAGNDGSFHPLAFDISHSSTYMYHSFPSGHAATAISISVSLALLFPRYRYFFILYGVIIAFSRVIVMQHFLSDVLVGSVIGYLISILSFRMIFPEILNLSVPIRGKQIDAIQGSREI